MKINLWMLALVIPLSFGIMLSACKKDDDPECETVDYTAIDASITAAQTMHDDATEGSAPGEYTPGSKATLQTAIDQAQAVRDKDCVTQAELDAAVVNLAAAVVTFQGELVQDVNPDALVAHWLFNGDGADASGNGHDGVASAGHAEHGAGTPLIATDRHGNDAFCFQFMNGANFVVANSPAFNPEEITIMVWMKLSETWAHNYWFSNDIWHSWKFQVQDANKPFFTRHVLRDGNEVHINQDTDAGILQNDTWTHVAMTFKSGELKFYLDGEMVKEWTGVDVSGTGIAPHDGIDLCIGQALPTDDYSADPEDPHAWKEWTGYFKGYLDDLRFYNEVLTGPQIKVMYDYENANTIE